MDGLQPPLPARDTERFVAFAFAGADMVAETDLEGVVTFAAGAYRSIFGRVAEAYVGQPLRTLVTPGDHELLGSALLLLAKRGRLPPMTIRLSDARRTHLALSGLALESAGRPARLCFTFARPPAPASSVLRAGTAHGLARATEARLRAGTPCDIGLIEARGGPDGARAVGEAIGRAIEAVIPDAVASEVAVGRFGVLGVLGLETALEQVAQMITAATQTQGVNVAVTACHLPIQTGTLTPAQAARALRRALNVFAQDGAEGFARAGFGAGLDGYLRQASARTGRLRDAICAGRFTLAFQPIVTLATGATHHHEALIRPQPLPDCEIASPQDFVMLIETLGLANELDLAVARVACGAAERAGRPVAFNISGQSVQDPTFRDQLVRLLAAHPARHAGLITVEMTETAEIEDTAEARIIADALRAIDVPFCLDDFGAGAADMRLLRFLEADVVKLDGSYIPGIGQEGRERAFLAGMIEIAHAAGATVVAERVETEMEAEVLRGLGVEFAQGWLYGRPGKLAPGGPSRSGASTLLRRGRHGGNTGSTAPLWSTVRS